MEPLLGVYIIGLSLLWKRLHRRLQTRKPRPGEKNFQSLRVSPNHPMTSKIQLLWRHQSSGKANSVCQLCTCWTVRCLPWCPLVKGVHFRVWLITQICRSSRGQQYAAAPSALHTLTPLPQVKGNQTFFHSPGRKRSEDTQ